MLGGRGVLALGLVIGAAGCIKSPVETPDETRPKMVITGAMMRSALADPNLQLPRDADPAIGEAVWKVKVFVDANRSFTLDAAYPTDDVTTCAVAATEAGARILAAFPYASSGLASVRCTGDVRAELEITDASVVLRAGKGEVDMLFGIVERSRAAASAP